MKILISAALITPAQTNTPAEQLQTVSSGSAAVSEFETHCKVPESKYVGGEWHE